MHELQLSRQLSHVARRIGRLWMWQRLTGAWICLAVLLIVWAVAGRPMVPESAWFLVAVSIATLVWIRSVSLKTSRTAVARQIELAFPDLNSRLLAAIEQSPDIKTGRMNVLQRQVIAEAVHHARMNDWSDAVSPRRMMRAFLGQTAAFCSFGIVCFLAMQATSTLASAVHRSHAKSMASAELPITVEPGDADLERGSSLLVLARFTGRPPADVHVIWKGPDQTEHRVPLAKSLDDPVFATRLTSVKEDLSYRIEFDGKHSADYQIKVYDLPTLVRSSLHLQYPSYTQRAMQKLDDAFEATVVEGTQVAITCHVNKPLASVRLVSADTSLDLQPDATNPLIYSIQLTPTKRMRLKLELVDSARRQNRDAEEFRIDVVPNRVPDLKFVFPGSDVKSSPLEEVAMEATAMDDFGIVEAGIVVQIPGRDSITLPLGQNLTGSTLHKFSSLLRLEEYRIQPDELVTYYLSAIDFGPDGQPRQTSSDLYFIEVRAFDEIFRQVDQQGAGEAQQSQKPPETLAKLLELQRQIIIATWKLARMINPKWSPKIAEQTETIHESQSQAILKLKALREKMTQPQLQPIIATALSEMTKARQELGLTTAETGLAPLKPASIAEQSAYHALLKLRAKEHLLVQSQSKGNGQQNEEKEKHELELKRNKNRYESEKTGAKQQESSVSREALAVLDRLKELARRQEGINQQLKELEAQMRQAQTELEKEELDRQLKRLREEQQQLLHDSDELRNKLNKSAQQEMVAETKQQLEQTRQRMVETAEKLREGQLSQALNSGTRAERELKQMHADFRQHTAAQFADAMRSLRDAARRLSDREKQLAEQLTQLGDEARRSLRQSQERAQLEAEFEQQLQQTNEIVNQAKQVVEQAETSEPLLSKSLYDTLRTTRESKLDQALSATGQLLKQGFVSEANKAEQQAQAGIEQLKQGIEKAAESVLGNEVDSLKRARRELAELSKQLDQEIQSHAPQQNADGVGKSPSEEGKNNKGEPGSGNSSDEKTPGQKPGQGSGDTHPSDKTADGKGQAGAKGSNPAGEPSPNPGKGAGAGAGAGQGSGSGQGSGDSPNPADSNGDPNSVGQGPTGSSDASSPTTPQPDAEQKPTGLRGPVGLRSGKGSQAPRSSPSPGREQSSDENSDGGGSPGNSQGGGPITGANFTEFNERLRDVESMISDPQLQAEVQKVRDRARSTRAEFKRHTQTPNWNLVRTSVHQPMIELQQRLAEEIAKQESPDSLVPIDRDPVPTRYRDLVRGYYERLGSGKEE